MSARGLVITLLIMLAAALGMSLYLWHLRTKASVSNMAADVRPVAPPVSGPTEQATLYVAYDDPGMLRAQNANIPLPAGRQERAEELLTTLLGLYLDKNSAHPLPAGAEIRDVYLIDPDLAVVDMNGALADGHRSGVLVEELTVASVVETLAANIPGISRVKILVDGKERDTLAGHVDLTGFLEVNSVNQMVGQLQAGQ